MLRREVVGVGSQQQDHAARPMIAHERGNQQLAIEPSWHNHLHGPHASGPTTPECDLSTLAPGQKAIEVCRATVAPFAGGPWPGAICMHADGFDVRMLWLNTSHEQTLKG
jgi:hypothetical protein